MVEEIRYKVPFEEGHRIIGTIAKTKPGGVCHWGHKVGDEFELSIYSPGRLCGVFYTAIFPYIYMLQMGAKFPKEWGREGWDGNWLRFNCTDLLNFITMDLRRVGPYRPSRVISEGRP